MSARNVIANICSQSRSDQLGSFPSNHHAGKENKHNIEFLCQTSSWERAVCIGSISGDILRTNVSTQKGETPKIYITFTIKGVMLFSFFFVFHPNFLHDLSARTVRSQTACGEHQKHLVLVPPNKKKL